MSKLIVCFFSGLLFLTLTRSALAFPRELFVSFAFPLRSLDLPRRAGDLPRALVPIASLSATPLSWYPDFTVLSDPQESAYFQSLQTSDQQEIGLLLEVTPQLLSAARLPGGTIPHLLNSYLPQVRRLLIDTAFARYYELFGRYPRSVAAPYLDSYSLEYLSRHYSVNAAVFTQNQPTIFPYFSYTPSRFNSLLPAQTEKNHLPLVINFLNPPDLFGESITPINIEATLKDFARKDLNENSRLILGTDNSSDPGSALSTFTTYFDAVVGQRHQLSINRLTVADFGTWFNQSYPLTSPAYYYRTTRGNQTVVYYQNPFYRLKLEQTGDQRQLTDLTVYNERLTEEYRQAQNLSSFLDLSLPSIVTKDQPISLSLNLFAADYTTQDWRLKIANFDQALELTPQEIRTKNINLDLPSSPQINRFQPQADRPLAETYQIDSTWLPFHTPTFTFVINALRLLILALLVYWVLGRLGLNLKLKISNLNLVVILLGSLLWSITSFKSGSHTIYGLSFWGPHGHDAFVHLSLIESFKRSLWPLVNPTLVNSLVVNYHVLFDYSAALLSRFLNIPALDLYFRYLLPLLAVLIGLLSARLLKCLKFSRSATVISLFLIYTAGSLGFVRGGESLFWANQAISTLINPPFALSLVLLLAYFNLLAAPLSWRRVLILTLLSGFLVQAKAYAAVLLVLALSLYCLVLLIRHRLNRYYLALFILTGAALPLFLLPTYSSGSSLFIFSPLWFTKALVSSPDRLYLPFVSQALLNYPLQNQLAKFIFLELLFTFVFLIGNLGLRLFSLPYLLKRHQTLPHIHLLLTLIIALGTLLPLLFIQTANPWNTIQFFYYSLFFLALFSGPTLAKLFQRLRTLPAFIGLLFIIVLGTLPTTYLSLRDYLSPIPAAYIGYQELLTLDRLSRLPPGLVVSPEYNLPASRSYADPKPIFAYASTAYVSALTGQPSLIADEINLQISNYDYQAVAQDQRQFYRTTSSSVVESIIAKYQPNYVLNNPQFLGPFFDGHNFSLYTIKR